MFIDSPCHLRSRDLRLACPSGKHSRKKDAFALEVVAPGLRKEDFSISIDKKYRRSLQNKRKRMKGKMRRGVIRREYKAQSFKRSFTLSDQLDADKISATYKSVF